MDTRGTPHFIGNISEFALLIKHGGIYLTYGYVLLSSYRPIHADLLRPSSLSVRFLMLTPTWRTLRTYAVSTPAPSVAARFDSKRWDLPSCALPVRKLSGTPPSELCNVVRVFRLHRRPLPDNSRRRFPPVSVLQETAAVKNINTRIITFVVDCFNII